HELRAEFFVSPSQNLQRRGTLKITISLHGQIRQIQGGAHAGLPRDAKPRKVTENARQQLRHSQPPPSSGNNVSSAQYGQYSTVCRVACEVSALMSAPAHRLAPPPRHNVSPLRV